MKEKTEQPQPRSLTRFEVELRQIIAEDIANSYKKRPQIAEEMKALTGVPITSFMLDSFTATAESKGRVRFPAVFIGAFCEVVQSDRLRRFLMGTHLLSLVEYAERELAAAKDERERLALRDELIEQRGKRR
jgi:hypothetical protein